MTTMAECGRGWAKRCASSKGKKCRCQCGGTNHGRSKLDAAAQDVIDFAKRSANWSVARDDDESVTIRDNGPWDKYPTITNSADSVVAEVFDVLQGRRLFYYDSDGRIDELLVSNTGRFMGFAPLDQAVAS
jgi:hypothetical protein